MPTKKGFRLTDDDIAIISHAYRFRLLTIPHLQKLTGRSRVALNVRLLKLTQRRYLYRKRFPFRHHVYTINRAAVPILVTQGVASKEDADSQVATLVKQTEQTKTIAKQAGQEVKRLRELTDLFLEHALLQTEIHLHLYLASKHSPIKLIEWQEGKQLYDSVTFRDADEEKKYPVRPDAFFALEHKGDKFYFFLEADRSTTTHQRFQKKIKAYWHYYHQSLHMQKYNIEAKAFRVITITLTEARAQNLAYVASQAFHKNVGGFYYFAPITRLSLDNPSRIFDDIFISAKDFDTDQRYRLVKALAPQKPNA